MTWEELSLYEPPEWFEIDDNTPTDGWLLVRSGAFRKAAIRDEEEGWWEDETGDYSVEARHNPNGWHGLEHWAYLPAEYEISSWEGTNRHLEPKATPAEGG